jgi:hypothetical protein
MSTFSQLTAKTRAPARTLVLEPWVFADEWEGKPGEPVCVGLRLMSEADKGKARAEAEKHAHEMHPNGGPNWTDAFNDCLIRQVAALGLCDPNDVSKPCEILRYAEEQVRFAITSRGARSIFDAHERYEIESSPLEAEATDEELTELAELLDEQPEALRGNERRLLRHVLEVLRARADN